MLLRFLEVARPEKAYKYDLLKNFTCDFLLHMVCMGFQKIIFVLDVTKVQKWNWIWIKDNNENPDPNREGIC